jgi:hypothetical protein
VLEGFVIDHRCITEGNGAHHCTMQTQRHTHCLPVPYPSRTRRRPRGQPAAETCTLQRDHWGADRGRHERAVATRVLKRDIREWDSGQTAKAGAKLRGCVIPILYRQKHGASLRYQRPQCHMRHKPAGVAQALQPNCRNSGQTTGVTAPTQSLERHRRAMEAGIGLEGSLSPLVHR